MNELLDILSDVMLIATFQWRDKNRQGEWHEGRPGASPHHRLVADRHPIRRARP
ncbi:MULTISPECIES: hypothetical protein [unclassified Mesorhizobium]|uniref:hypothetical protein n=1 Tax=unclassified Mesorhizobium TaxID=325217 RepID=UPI0015E30295|nr:MULTISPECIES: hypothetical protein [unclassified Mesorhizobium]